MQIILLHSTQKIKIQDTSHQLGIPKYKHNSKKWSQRETVEYNISLKLETEMKEIYQNQNEKIKHLEEKKTNIQEHSNTFCKRLENLTN